jgi:hypothetical protein
MGVFMNNTFKTIALTGLLAGAIVTTGANAGFMDFVKNNPNILRPYRSNNMRCFNTCQAV